MTTPTSRENSTRSLSTADLAAASRRAPRVNPDPHDIDDPHDMDEAELSSLDREARDEARERARGEARDEAGENEREAAADEMLDDPRGPAGDLKDESLEPLFAADQAEGYRTRWLEIQSSFVDDPSAAVRAGDELVARVMSELANTFAGQRRRIESQLGTSGPGNTEDLRVALRSYRSFFERLLAL